ncbi:MAG: putative DNA binding domain-containing protein [Salinivirgaceae bacterium]|nr:putative DNA binding domain-containing protein [Salinivirgaceae bacterium]
MIPIKIKQLRESEDKVELKKASTQFNFNNGRRSVLGYVVALANEGGGMLVLGVSENSQPPHEITGSKAWQGCEGKLEEDIYRALKIRIATEVVYEDNKRVLIIHIPSRPVGKTLKFEDVPLMRVGEELLPMSDEQLLKILQEQEPDFTAKICKDLMFSDLDDNAILKLKEAYSKKQDNASFLTLNNEQALSDLELITEEGVTYAALILAGKTESIKRYLPQTSVNLEFRNSTTQINFDNRILFSECYFKMIEKVWEIINQRNGKVPVQQGPYIFDIPFFNKEVIREAINNAIAHRDYRRTSEVIVKQFPYGLHIINPGGFPLGVTLANLLTVNSTPRNRLLADVMAKTGVVERSGQGVDKIFYQTITEAKPSPDYSRSDNFQVELRLSAIVEDKAFSLFIHQIQQERKDADKLSVLEVITLNQIRKEVDKSQLDKLTLNKLLKEGLVEQHGKTKGAFYMLSKDYFEFTDEKGKYSKSTDWDERQMFLIILQHLQKFGQAKMGDFVDLFEGRLSNRQIRYTVGKLVQKNDLQKDGENKGTVYSIGTNFKNTLDILTKAINIGMQQMKNNGEIG